MDQFTFHTIAKARQVILAGWTQKTHSDGTGGFCIEGAVCNAAGADGGELTSLDNDGYRAAQMALEALAASLPDDWCISLPPGPRLAAWNDVVGRTQGEVLSLFESVLDRSLADCAN